MLHYNHNFKVFSIWKLTFQIDIINILYPQLHHGTQDHVHRSLPSEVLSDRETCYRNPTVSGRLDVQCKFPSPSPLEPFPTVRHWAYWSWCQQQGEGSLHGALRHPANLSNVPLLCMLRQPAKLSSMLCYWCSPVLCSFIFQSYIYHSFPYYIKSNLTCTSSFVYCKF